MKKIISFIATVAMVSSLFVSVVKADFQPTVTSVVGEKVSNEAFNDFWEGEDIPEGYDVYPVTVSFSNLGDLNCTVSKKKHSGRKLQGFGYEMTFDDIDNVDVDYTSSFDGVVELNSEGFDGSKYSAIFNAGAANAAYPTTAGTISNDDGIEDIIIVWVVVKQGVSVTATLNTYMNIVTYSSDVYGAEEQTNFATMSPASLVFGSASAPDPTPADIVPAAADSKVVGNATTGLKDADGKNVTIDASRSYGAAKFDNVVIDDGGDYVYKVFATGTNKATSAVETKEFDVANGDIEVTGAAISFIAIVRSATHTITSVVLKAFAKPE